MAQGILIPLLIFAVLWTSGSSIEDGRGVQITDPSTSAGAVLVGKSFTLTCSGRRGDALTWYLSGKRLDPQEDSGYAIYSHSTPSRRTTKLIIDPVSLRHSGLYTCGAGDGTESDTFNLDVQDGWVSINGSSVRENGRIYIECRAPLGTTVEWLKNGEPLSVPGPSFMILGQEDQEEQQSISQLALDPVSDYGGEYTCRNSQKTLIEDKIVLSLPTTPPSLNDARVHITHDDNLFVPEGESFGLQCRGRVSTPLVWSLNDVMLEGNSAQFFIVRRVVDGKQEAVLVVDYASVQWDGQYTCAEQGDRSNADSVTVNVIRNTSAPRITSDKFLTVPLGEDFTVRCEAGPRAALFWTLDGHQLVPGPGLVVMTTMTTSGQQLTAVTVTAADQHSAGVYACRDRRNPRSGEAATVTIQPQEVTASVRMLSPRTPNISLEYRQPFTLICAGPMTTRPTWYYNHQVLWYQPNVLVSNTIDVITNDLVVVLTRLSPDAGASGIYSCKDSEHVGTGVDVQVNVRSQEQASGGS